MDYQIQPQWLPPASKKKKKSTLTWWWWASEYLWKECVLASKDDPKREVLKIFWAVTTSLEQLLRLLRWFLWRWNTDTWCGYEKKLVMWFCAWWSYVTIWEKREAPYYFQVCSQGKKWVKNGEGQEKGLVYPSPMGCVFSVLPPSGHMREWLVEKAQWGWPALPRQARY